MNIKESVIKMKTVSPVLAASPAEVRNEALIKISEALTAHAEEIFAANARDLAAADEKGVAPAR